MANTPVTEEEAKAFYEVVEKKLREGHPPKGVRVTNCINAVTAAAEEIGLASSTAPSRLKICERLLRYQPDWDQYRPAEKNAPDHEDYITLPEFPDDDISAEEILDHLEKRFEAHRKRADAEKWFKIKIKSDDPIGLAFVGDPHLGVHADISTLRHDVGIISTTPGLYACNLGDSVNNWSSRLLHLYAEEDISRPTERILAKWFLQEAGIKWLVWLAGNHDMMNTEFLTYLKTINANQLPMVDWTARFILQFPSADIRIDARHDHKGHSQYNRLHGQKKAALFDEHADLYIAGHRHTWALATEELNEGVVCHYARARGYKYGPLDDYAVRGQFQNDAYGATITYIIDPTASPAARLHGFADLKHAKEFLEWKRATKQDK